MPNDLVDDPIVAQNFFLELDGATDKIGLISVGSFEMDMEVAEVHVNTAAGIQMRMKTRGLPTKVPDFTVTRMAPRDVSNDPIWTWFNEVRSIGFANREAGRKNGSVVFLGTDNKTELGRFNFYHAWIKTISTSDMETQSNEPMRETITIVCERIERNMGG